MFGLQNNARGRTRSHPPNHTARPLVPNLRHIETVPGAGHFVQMQEPDRVNAAILEFLEGV